MLQKGQAIALHSIRYGESGMVAYLYSQEFGRITLMVHGAYGSRKDSKKSIYFQPLSLVNVVFYPGKQGMGKLKEVSSVFMGVSIASSPIKAAIALFLGEVIYRVVKEEEGNPYLFSFLEFSIRKLEEIKEGIANFHLLFLAQLSKHLGFFPSGNFSEQTQYFNFRDGLFEQMQPNHPYYFSPFFSKVLSDALELDYEQGHQLILNGNQRSSFLEQMLGFYRYHTDQSVKFQSLLVLQQVFSE